MSGKARAVLWIGLIIVALNLSLRWSDIKGIIFSGSGGGSGSGSGSGGSQPILGGQGSVGPGSVTVPFGGFPITIPVSKTPASVTTPGVTTLLWQPAEATS